MTKFWQTAQQTDAVKMLLSGKDIFITLPMGGEKSVCLPSVVNELQRLSGSVSHHLKVSLMMGQVAKLSGRGIKATYVRTTISAEEEGTASTRLYT